MYAIIIVLFIFLYLDEYSQTKYYKSKYIDIKKKYKYLEEKILKLENNNSKNELDETNLVMQSSSMSNTNELVQNNQELNEVPINQNNQSINKEVINQNTNYNSERENLNVAYEKSELEINKNQEKPDINSFSEQVKRNTYILISGAFLVVLSAIVFLTSSWGIIPNMAKTGILLSLFAFFLGFSKLAEKKFELPKTGETFFNIAMAYLPICILSMSLLKTVGDFFSIDGEGRFIFLSSSFLITTLIYYINYLKTKSKNLFIGSLISGFSTIVLGTLIFTSNIVNIAIVLLSYDLLQKILYTFSNKKMEKEHLNIINFVNIICSIIFILFFCNGLAKNDLFYGIFEEKQNMFKCILGFALCASNFLVSYKNKEYEESIILYYLYTYSIAFILFTGLNISINIKIILSLFIIALIMVFNNLVYKYLLKSDDSNKNNLYYYLVSIALLYIVSLTHFSSISVVIPFLISFIEVLSLILINKKYNIKSLKPLIPIVSSISLYNLIYIFVKPDFKNVINTLNYFIIFSVILFVISIICKKLNKKEYSNMFLLIADSLSFFFLLEGIVYNTPYLQQLFLLLASLTTLFMYGYTYYQNRKFDFLKAFIYFLIYYSLVFLIALVPISTINMQYLIPGFILSYGITMYSLKNQKITFDTFIGFLALLIFVFNVNSIYIKLLGLIGWEFLNYNSTKEINYKSLFLGMLYISSYLLYAKIIFDLNLSLYAYLIVAYVVGILMIKTIIDKYSKDFEYPLMGLLYIISIFLYRDLIVDGIICVSFMFLILIFSYSKNYGALFVVTLVSVLINIILLTRELWFSMPWWAYLLLVGVFLIIFAAKKESEEKLKIKNSLLNLKEKIDNNNH